MKRTLLLHFLLWVNASLPTIAQTCYSGGTGADGPYQATSNGTLAGGEYNFTTFTIDAGVTITVTGDDPLIIHCTGAVTINGALEAIGGNGGDGITNSTAGAGGEGVAGGADGGGGAFSASLGPLPGTSGSGPGGSNNFGNDWSGGGGAGYSTVGIPSSSPTGGFGGPEYGTPNVVDLFAGSGGGGGSGGFQCGGGGGGGGGGVISIQSAVSITIGATGTINCDGGVGGSDGTGNCGGGGGGSGGTIWLAAPTVTNDGSLSALGGSGGTSNVPGSPYFGDGGGGADGRIRIDSNTPLSGTGSTNPAVGFTVSVPTQPLTATAAGTDVTCFGDADGSVTATPLDGVAPFHYLWTPTGDTTAVIAGLPPDTYICVITDDAGCSTSVTQSIVEPDQLVVSIALINDPTTCGGTDGNISSTVSGGTGSYDYLWNSGETSADLNNVGAGSYSVTVTDANGCSESTGVLTLNDPPLPVVTLSLSTDSLCTTDPPLLLDGNTPTGGVFSGLGVSGNSFDPSIGAGDYPVLYSYTDVNNCTANASDTIHVELCTGLGTITESAELFHVLPNPNHGMFRIAMTNGGTEAIVRVTNALGQTVASYRVQGNSYYVDESRFGPGIFVITAEQAGRRQHLRMVIE